MSKKKKPAKKKGESYIVVDNSGLLKMLKRIRKLSDLELRVGVQSGKPKYPKGHVGRKSRIRERERLWSIRKDELARRSRVREARKELLAISDKDARKQRAKEIRAAFKERKESSRGLLRKGSPRVAVARVAGVLMSRTKYHTRGIESFQQERMNDALQKIADAMESDKSIVGPLEQLARDMTVFVRREIRVGGHVDTGRLMRTVDWAVVDRRGEKRARDLKRIERLAKKAAKIAEAKAGSE